MALVAYDKPVFSVNKLILGDNLEILKTFPKEGRQIIVLKTGTHNIAVKAVDNDGLENIEIIKITINGEIKREKYI